MSVATEHWHTKFIETITILAEMRDNDYIQIEEEELVELLDRHDPSTAAVLYRILGNR